MRVRTSADALDDEPAKVDAVLAWVVRPDGVIYHYLLPIHLLAQHAGEKGASDPINMVAKSFQATLPREVIDRILVPARSEGIRSVRAPETQKDILRSLHRVLIEPLRKHLPAGRGNSIIIIPDGELHLVPFNALLDEEGSYLIDRHALSMATSIGSLLLLHHGRAGKPSFPWRQQRGVLVIGDPSMPSLPAVLEPEGKIPQLPGADREARAIADMFKVRPLLGGQLERTSSQRG